MSRVIMPVSVFRLLTCAALVVAFGMPYQSHSYRTQKVENVASGPKLPIKSSFSGYIIAVG